MRKCMRCGMWRGGVFFLSLLCLWGLAALPEARGSSLSEREMRQIWVHNGGVQGEQQFQFGTVDWISRTAFVEGSSPLLSSTPQGKLLARRRAVTQAQKNLLYLLYELRYGLPQRIASIEVEGKVVMGHVDRQGLRGGDYVVEVALPLRRLFEECVVWRATVR